MARSHARIQVGDRFTHVRYGRWPDLSAVAGFAYMLMRGDEVVYVGSTGNIRERLSAHYCRPNGKVFDSATVIACGSPRAAWALEGELIHEHKPRHNVQLSHHGKRRGA